MADKLTPEAERPELEYARDHYLLFGADASQEGVSPNGALDCAGTLSYLGELGFSDSALTQARKRGLEAARYAGYRDPNAHRCDFCGREMSGVEYDVLRDGRERCPECSATVLRKRKDFERLLAQVREGMCAKYGINLPTPIGVKLVSQAKLAKMQGSRFVPTKGFDARAIGLAISRRGEYSMLLENGSPRVCLIATMAHELTHIWQYSHWNWAEMQLKYGGRFLAVCEGMAKWAEIQYLYLLNETSLADRFFEQEVNRSDIYGYGFRMFLNQYPLTKGICLSGQTPFGNIGEPIEL